MAAVTIRFGADARQAMLRGVDRLADAVAVTLGPRGRTVLIEQPDGAPPRVTKDGVTVADSLEAEDRFEQLGLRLARRAAERVGERHGDGTTTTLVLARALAAAGMKAVAAGLDPMALRRALETDVAAAVGVLRGAAVPVRGRRDYTRIATIAANGESALGRLIGEAFAAVGADGVVAVEPGRTFDTTWERLAGIQWEGGYVSPYFMTDPVTTECRYDNPLILLTDHALDDHAALLRPLEAAVRARRPLLIVAEAVRGDALQTLVANKIRNGLNVVAGKAPLFGDRRRAMLEDVAAVTGARLVSAGRGDDMARLDPAALGSAERIVLTADRTTVVGGAGTPAEIARRADAVRAGIGLDGNTPFEEKLLRERLAKLTGGVAVIRVGGTGETDISERRDRAEDAAGAVRAAAADGILAGGGSAYLAAGRALAADGDRAAATAETRAARRILAAALAAPATLIAANAGHDGRLVAARIAADPRPGFGFDAAAGRFRDLATAGIIDPAAVVIAALEAATSVAALLLTAEAVIARPPPPPRPTRADDIPFGPAAKDMTADEARGFGLVGG